MRETFKKLRYMAETALVFGAVYPLGILPRSLGKGIGRGVGLLLYYVLAKRRRIGLENIRRAQQSGSLPSDQRPEQILRSYFMRMGAWLVDLMKVYTGHGDVILDSMEVRGRENLDKALARGKGVLITTAHTSMWELLVLAVSVKCHPVCAVARRQNNPYIDRFIVGLREKYRTRIIYKEGAIRKFVSVLKENGVVGVAMDQHASPEQGVWIKFLGRWASAVRMPVAIARRTGAAMLPLFIREEGGRYIIEIEPHMEVLSEDDAAETARISEPIERFIREHPDQWLWIHMRWRDEQVPEGMR